ncbi:hypothetical protein NST74_07185 [Paenibacillus sp. FSL F4-0125]
MRTHWEPVAVAYGPAPVKQVEIPKPGGGFWLLVFPVIDRFSSSFFYKF